MVTILDDDFSLELCKGNCYSGVKPVQVQQSSMENNLGLITLVPKGGVFRFRVHFKRWVVGLFKALSRLMRRHELLCESFYKTGDEAKVVDPVLRQWITEDSSLTRMIAAQS